MSTARPSRHCLLSYHLFVKSWKSFPGSSLGQPLPSSERMMIGDFHAPERPCLPHVVSCELGMMVPQDYDGFGVSLLVEDWTTLYERRFLIMLAMA